MNNHRKLLVVTISALAIAGCMPVAKAATIDEVIARLNTLEKENAALAKQNATLSARVNRLESSKLTKTVSSPVPAAPPAAQPATPQAAYASVSYNKVPL